MPNPPHSTYIRRVYVWRTARNGGHFVSGEHCEPTLGLLKLPTALKNHVIVILSSHTKALPMDIALILRFSKSNIGPAGLFI